MLMDKYFETLDELFKTIRKTQRESMEKAADAIAESVSNGGSVHIFDSGHIINSELIHRAGGFIFMKPFNYSFSVNSNPRKRDTEPKFPATDADVVRLAFSRSNVRPGDIFILGSVSGKSSNIIEIGLGAKEAGCTLISMTSVAYSKGLESQHPSGKRLFEIGDILLDNCAPEGDAMMTVEGIEHKIIPASGLGASYILWAICADVTEKLMEKGKVPSILKSVNYPDGPQAIKEAEERYNKLGY